jgi:tetratricopeptide (TPR) repeat protein
MRAPIALILVAGLAACLRPPTAETVEVAWQQCDGDAADAYRLSQCSAVISFPGTTAERRAAALINRGAIRTSQGQYARALADIGRAMRISAQNPRIYLERGIVHQAQGAYDFALRDFDQALSMQPGLQQALERRAQVMQERGTAFRAELEQLNDMVSQSPRDPELLNNRCWLRAVNNDDLNAALADCNASLTARPNDANVMDSRGLVNFKRADYDAALAAYEAAVALEPQRGHFLYGRGLVRIGLGQVEEGRADLARAEELEPGVTLAYESYGALPPTPPSQLVAD